MLNILWPADPAYDHTRSVLEAVGDHVFTTLAKANNVGSEEHTSPLVYGRGLTGQINNKARFTEGQLEAMRLVTSCIAGLSFLSACLCLYWFLRMKRSFRHMSVACNSILDVDTS